MPVVLAFLMALTLTPVVRFLRKRGVPSALSATALVAVSAIGLGIIGYAMSGPVVDLIQDAPRIGRELRTRLVELKQPLDQVVAASKQIDDATNDVGDQPGVQKVVVAQPGIVSRAAGNLLSAGTTIAVTLVLSLFLLASGTMFYEKMIQSFATMSDKKRALRIVFDVEREISRYLLTVAVINSCLGTAVGVGLWVFGVPNALVWGVAAALLNFLPYIGAFTSIVVVGAISLGDVRQHRLRAAAAALHTVLRYRRRTVRHAADPRPAARDSTRWQSSSRSPSGHGCGASSAR